MISLKWPSLEQQLVAHKIPHDSALAQLVRDNQDFDMLRPEEANDDIDIPLWLRVYWRKLHPGSRHAPGDPTGGYPMAIDKILFGMLSHPDNPSGEVKQQPSPATGADGDGGKHGQ